MSVTGDPDGEPQKAGIPIADLMAGMYAAVSINAALRHREITGKGQHIDIGMLDTTTAMLSIQAMNYLATGNNPPRLGNQHPNIVPYQVFPTADGNIILACGNDAQFQRFCEFAERSDIAENPRYATNTARLQNRDELTDLLTPIIQAKPSQHWLKGLEERSVSCGPINTIEQVFHDEQVLARDMKIAMKHSATGDADVDMVGSPIKMSETGVSYRHAPPTLGQHTDEVLEEVLGMSTDEIAKLKANGTV